jgi:regulator of protease activity HflC (stomatin/prohibitin superfamily)
MKKIILSFGLLVLLAGCSRVETGEVGLRVGFDKQVQQGELLPGSFNQTFVGDVLIFQTKEIALQLNKLTPQTADKSTLADIDVTVIYSINPTSVFKLYTTKSHDFNLVDRGNTYLMYNYLTTVANSAIYKAVSQFNALDTTNHRGDIENVIMASMVDSLHKEGLDMDIHISQVQVKNILPDPTIVASANEVIRQQNALRAKEVEVQTAAAEAQRLKELASNPASIDYMHAKALQDIAEGIKEGKVKAVIVPYDFKGIVDTRG